MNSNDKGNLGYAMVIADVMKKGYFVFTPIADTTSVDMVIGNDKMELKRVQVKYRTKNKQRCFGNTNTYYGKWKKSAS